MEARTPEDIITDIELDMAWGNANFGDTPRREVITYTLKKIAQGWPTGHTARCIASELGLLSRHNGHNGLSNKGLEYLLAASQNPAGEAAGVGDETELSKMFKPYCVDYFSKEPDNIREEKIKFAFDNKGKAFELFQSLYDTNYGTITIEDNLISIHTGGWSDNEELVSYFKKTFWWQTNLRLQATGGNYYFDTDRQSDNEWVIYKSTTPAEPAVPVQADTFEPQFGISAHADFEEKTWTFEMPDDFKVIAGKFRITHVPE